MISRRQLIQMAAAASVLPLGCRRPQESTQLNDIHSKLNPTRVTRLARPVDLGDLEATVQVASKRGTPVSISGGRHSMGGQQFGTDTVNLDIRSLNRVLAFDPDRGTIEVESGIQWPDLVRWCATNPANSESQWGIRQKQTGADRLTLGGALASNIHGRGLTLPPIASDVESIVLMGAEGDLHRCSRTENPELFSMVLGGYGCFGVVYSLVLRLAPRLRIERVVELRSVDGLMAAFEQRIDQGFLFGDFQFKTDETQPDYLQTGVFSCYRPIPGTAPSPGGPAPLATGTTSPSVSGTAPSGERQRRLSRSRWQKLLVLAHVDKARAFGAYSDYYLSTNGQVYWSDTHQLSPYLDDYHRGLDRRIGARLVGSEMISEVYVPRSRLAEFMGIAADAFRRAGVDVIYGTIRLIERDEETFLPWAREPWACIVFNFHVDHSEEGLARARDQFRLLIDLAIEQRGSYFLTYHRWASRAQVEACYPQMSEFLRRKLEWDPDERFQSDWYRHYREMFATDL